MKRFVVVLVLLSVAGSVAACGTPSDDSAHSPVPSAPSTSPPAATPTPEESGTPTGAVTPTPSPTPSAKPTPEPSEDSRWRFFTDDTTAYSSPWYPGTHRIMIGFGCTEAPYYDPDPRCDGGQGFHHGVDVAIPCGVELTSAVDATVADPSGPGSPGPAYGDKAFRLRTDDVDILIGHAEEVLVEAGEQVRAGQRIALVGDLGAPDGCHLHLEVRTPGGGVSSATDPEALLDLSS